MGQAVQSTGQDFWRSPTVLDPPVESHLAPAVQYTTAACEECSTEFMIGARFCHSCGVPRPALPTVEEDTTSATGLWQSRADWLWSRAARFLNSARKLSLPSWLRYLHFHEIKEAIGLPTASLVAFLIGVGCIAGAVSVGVFYKASNLAEFQAIQMWRMEWLLAATASFVGGILLKKPSKSDSR